MKLDTSFPTLYKLNQNGRLQMWNISVQLGDDFLPYIVTTFGIVDGKTQTTKDPIREGKNIGRANATTPVQQARNEAASKHRLYKERGYAESQEEARAGKNSFFSIKPMLAKDYEKRKNKVQFPCYVQPKLDGMRCLAVITRNCDEFSIELFSRNGKPITSVPHIEKALEKVLDCMADNEPDQVVLDGELYNHDLRDGFEKIISAVRKQKPSPESESVEYWVYDWISCNSFDDREKELVGTILHNQPENSPIISCPSTMASTHESIQDAYKRFLDKGYEGVMVRNMNVGYEGKRTDNLLKYKPLFSDEFKITGVHEGRGKLVGHAAAFVCETPSGHQFKAKLKGSTKRLKELWENPSLWTGKLLTVEYQNLTNDGVPRFPIAVEIRDYE